MDTKYLEIIKAPVVTEKSGAMNQIGKYVFKVDPKANKTEIKLAIEKIFHVHVKSIRSIIINLQHQPKERKVLLSMKKLRRRHQRKAL